MIIVNKIKWLNEIHIEEQLGRSKLSNVTSQYPKYLKKQRQELQGCLKQPCRRFLREDFAIQIIMDCRTIPAVKFRNRLGFNQHDPIMTKEQSILTKLDNYFKTEDKLFQHYILGYRIDLYVPKYKLAIEVDELGYWTRGIKSEIERQQRLERELNCKFIRIDPSRENFNIVDEFCKIKNHIRESTKDEISGVLLDVEFKSNNSIKTKILKWVVKTILP